MQLPVTVTIDPAGEATLAAFVRALIPTTPPPSPPPPPPPPPPEPLPVGGGRIERVGPLIHINGAPSKLHGVNLEAFGACNTEDEPTQSAERLALTLAQVDLIKQLLGCNAIRLNVSPGDFAYWSPKGLFWPWVLPIIDRIRSRGMVIEWNWWNVATPGGRAEVFPWGPVALRPVWRGDLNLHRQWLLETARMLGRMGDIIVSFWDEPIKGFPGDTWEQLHPHVQDWVTTYRGADGRNLLSLGGNHYARDTDTILTTHKIVDPLEQWFVRVDEFSQGEFHRFDDYTKSGGVAIETVLPIVIGGTGWAPVDGPPPDVFVPFLDKIRARCQGIFWWAWHMSSTPNMLDADQGFPGRNPPVLTAYGQWVSDHRPTGLRWTDSTAPPAPPPGGNAVRVLVTANADPYESTTSPGMWPLASLYVAGERIGGPVEVDVDARSGAWKTVEFPLVQRPADSDEIAIAFTNDAASPVDWTKPGNDRNLHIKHVRVSGGGAPDVILMPETAVYRGDDGAARDPAGPTMFRNGRMIWADLVPPPVTPPSPPPPPTPGPTPTATWPEDEILLPSRRRITPLDPRSVPFDQRPVFVRDIVVDIRRGSDGNQGDEARPLKTIDAGQRRARELGPGTRIQVRDGIYDFGSAPFVWSTDGNPNGWYAVVGYPGERPELRARGWDCFHAKGHYFLAEGLRLNGSRVGYVSPWTGRKIESDDQFNEEARARIGNKTHEPGGWDSSSGLIIAGGMKSQGQRGVHHVIVRDIIAEKWPGSGFGSAGMDYILMEDCLADDNCYWMGWGGSGVSIFGPKDQGKFGNESHRIVVRRSICSRNIQYKNTFGRNSISDGGGFQADVYASEFAYKHRTLFYSCLAYGNGQSGLHSTSSGFVDYVNSTCFANNQHPQNRGAPEMWVGWESPDCQYLGNVLISGFGGVPLGMVQTASDRPRTSRNNVLSKATPFMGQGDVVTGDARFVNATIDPRTANFRLRADSPARGLGEALATTDLFGNAFTPKDAGAIWGSIS